MKRFCLPADFKTGTIDRYMEINEKRNDSVIFETYGRLTGGALFGSCRANAQVPEVDIDGLEEYVRYSREKDIEFNYVLDATCMENRELTREGYRELRKFLRQLVDMGVNSVTVSLPSVMEISGYVAPKLKVVVSQANHVNSPQKAAAYAKLEVDRIILDEDIYRNFELTRKIKKACPGIGIEVVVNSFCLNGCPYRISHCNSLSHLRDGDKAYPYYFTRCREQHASAEAHMKLNWIRPDDIRCYLDAGVTYFRLQGIDLDTCDTVKAVTCYMDEYFEGNLIALLELFSTNRPLSILGVRINNRSLDGFIDRFVEDGPCSGLCSECGYCRRYGERAMKASDAVLLDFAGIADEVARERFFKEMERRNNLK